MSSQIIEYSAADTPEGFLRWYRRKERDFSSLSHSHNVLMALRNRRTWARGLRYIPILLVLLVPLVGYISTIYSVVFQLPSVFSVSFERVTVNGRALCTVSLVNDGYNCINGSVDIRIQNNLWFNVESLEGLHMTWRPCLISAEKGDYCWRQLWSFDRVEVPSRSDRIYTLKLVSYFPETSVQFDLPAKLVETGINIRVLGYDFDMVNQQQDQNPLIVNSRGPTQGESLTVRPPIG